VHARDLSYAEHEHCIVVDIVHVIHEHIAAGAIIARYMGKSRRTIIRQLSRWCILDIIAAAAIFRVTPDMPKIEEVSDFMDSSASEIKWRGGGSRSSKSRIENGDAVSFRWSPRKLCVT
jgi:hypothetical protein